MSPDHDLVRPLDALFRAWRRATPLAEQCIETVRDSAHGDLPRWLRALGELPAATPSCASFDATVVIGRRCDLTPTQVRRLAATLHALKPWRKGPFELFGVRIDAEWRSDHKWARIAPHIDLSGAPGARCRLRQRLLRLAHVGRRGAVGDRVGSVAAVRRPARCGRTLPRPRRQPQSGAAAAAGGRVAGDALRRRLFHGRHLSPPRPRATPSRFGAPCRPGRDVGASSR